jgi:enoyl-[acyl-carrier protein] reductase II
LAHENFKKDCRNQGRRTSDIEELASSINKKNKFFRPSTFVYEKCPTKEKLTTFLGRARAKRYV